MNIGGNRLGPVILGELAI